MRNMLIMKDRAERSWGCGECSTDIKGLTVSYGGNRAVENVDLHFSCGELTAITGPNGGGKSSILKAILGQVEYQGKICFPSSNRNGQRPRIGYVPQNVAIQQDSPLSVCDLLLISEGYLPAWMGITRKKRAKMIDLLSLVSAENLADRKVGELSGGELQRVLLACSLNPIPDILLLDEPVSAVDANGMKNFYEIICNLRRMFHMAIVLVTHDVTSIAQHADILLVVNKKVIIKGRPVEVLGSREFISLMGSVYVDPADILKDLHCHGDKA
ncbi:MAG: metal ABC transporter ATP-binding protein [Spirochaetes bacterium]|jgi:zinc transport system ATP-binding protein|nr:metal ABC transporter ATP-binding protein [Spirochaetota bacterium]